MHHRPRDTGPVVGRSAERGQLGEFLAGAAGGSLLLRGQPGSGKTTLVEETVRLAAEKGYAVAWSTPAEVEAGTPWLVLVDLLDDLLAHQAAASVTPAQFDLLTQLHRGGSWDTAGSWLPQAAAVRDLLRAVGAAQPVLVVVDDVQWADPASRRVLSHARQRVGPPVRFLLAERRPLLPSMATGAPGADGVTSTLDLAPMPGGDLDELLRTRCPDIPRARRALAAERSGANPLFAIELASTDLRNDEALPDSLTGLIDSGLASLAAPGLDVAGWIAVLARPSTADLEQASGDSRLVHVGLSEAESAGLVVTDGTRWSFVHPLFASAVRHRLSEAESRVRHSRAAALAPSLAQRAGHLARATSGPDAGVAAVLDEAARQAADGGAQEAAARFWRDALRLSVGAAGDTVASRWSGLGEALLRLDDLRGASAAAAHAERAAASDDLRASALQVRARAEQDLEGPCAAVHLLRRALEGTLSADRRSEVLQQLLLRLTETGEIGQIDAVVDQLSAAADSDHLRTVAASRRVLYVFQQGRLTTSAALAALGLLDQSEPLVEDATTNVALWAGRLEIVEAAWEQVLGDMAALGDTVTMAEVRLARVDLDLRLGRLDVARETLAGLAADPAAGRDGVTAELRARHAVLVGDWTGAREQATSALEVAADTPWLTARAHACLGLVDLHLDEPRAALAHFERARTADPALLAWRHGFCFIGADRAEALARAGHDGADEAVRDLESLAARWGDDWALAVAARSRGEERLSAADLPGAEASAAEAVERGRDLPWRIDLARSLLLLARVGIRANRRRLARDRLAEAGALLEPLGAHGLLQAVDRQRRRIGGRAQTSTLTPAEHSVARLVAQGLSNREVAARLVIGERTVESHLTHAYAKAGVRSRTALAAWLLAEGYAGPGDQTSGISAMR